jgi:cell division septation protein DedD
MYKEYSKRRRPRKRTRDQQSSRWPWLMMGLLLGLILPGLLYLKSRHTTTHNIKLAGFTQEDDTLILKPNTKAITKSKHFPVKKEQSKEEHKSENSHYDFYNMLTNSTDETSDNAREKNGAINNKDSSATRYLLQIASSKNFVDIDKLKAELTLLGYEVFVTKIKRGDDTWFRVNVGPFRSQAQAQKARNDLQQNNVKSLLKIM